jgi:hypothetical protein
VPLRFLSLSNRPVSDVPNVSLPLGQWAKLTPRPRDQPSLGRLQADMTSMPTHSPMHLLEAVFIVIVTDLIDVLVVRVATRGVVT